MAIPPVAIASPAPLASIHSGAEPGGTRLAAHEHHVAGERAGRQARQQLPFGGGIQIPGKQQRVRPSDTRSTQ